MSKLFFLIQKFWLSLAKKIISHIIQAKVPKCRCGIFRRSKVLSIQFIVALLLFKKIQSLSDALPDLHFYGTKTRTTCCKTALYWFNLSTNKINSINHCSLKKFTIPWNKAFCSDSSGLRNLCIRLLHPEKLK